MKKKYYCIEKDCGKEVSNYRAKRCQDCHTAWSKIPKNNGNWQGGKVEIKCNFCGKKVYKKRGYLKIHKHLFCSRKCHYNFMKELFRDPRNNPYIRNKKIKFLTKELLYKLYIEDKQSTYNIAKEFNTYAGTVLKYLRKFEIKIRNRNEAGKLAFKQNRSNIEGENNPRHIDGRTLIKHYCIDCLKKGIKTEISLSNWFSGNKTCASCAHLGEKGSNWQGGLSKTGYTWEFTDELKESIRKRDNYTCQNCGMTEEEQLIINGKVLYIHHIDYDKKNCKENNLITTCFWCNVRANYNKDYWQNFYKIKIVEKINVSN